MSCKVLLIRSISLKATTFLCGNNFHRFCSQNTLRFKLLLARNICTKSFVCQVNQPIQVTHFLLPKLARFALHSELQKRNFFLSTTVSITRSSADIISQPNLVIMKLDSPEFHSILTPELQSMIDLFQKYGYELRIAGGAVRDLVAGKTPDDIDFATTATPEQMKEMFTKEDIRMINANGEAHGTITARVNDKENFEITTLRIDVVTDGRRAEVEFTKDWMLDANRRDLTVNSMFLGFDGTVYDYFNGLQDLKERRVRFVGSPEQRIQEDYLRILRYFRFYGRLATGPDNHEQITIDAIRDNVDGLQRVSGERIWIEMRKIMTGRMTASILQTMIEVGLGPYIGLPNAKGFSELSKVCEITEGTPHHHMTRLAALLDEEADVYSLKDRCKISNDELSLALFIVQHRGDQMGNDLIGYCTDLHCDSAGKETKVKDKIVELMKYCGHLKAAKEFPDTEMPQLPITGHDLTQNEVPRGPPFAFTLKELRRIWKESGYKLQKDQLVEQIPGILENLPPSVKKIKKK